MFVIDQQFSTAGKRIRRLGILCLVQVFPVNTDIQPHERTFPGPRRGRYELMKSLGCQPEPIFLITPSADLAGVALSVAGASAPSMEFEEPLGVLNRVYAVSDPSVLERMASALSRETAIVADGHHRLAAVREIAEERSARGDSSWNSILAYVAPTVGNGMLIGGIHRVVGHAEGRTLSLSRAGDLFDLAEVTDAAQDSAIRLYDGRLMRAVPNQTARATLSEADFGVPPDVVNRLLFKRCLNLSDVDIEKLVTYTHDADYARGSVDSGEADFSVLMPGWDPDEFIRKVSDGRMLPQKSTFFHPKVPSGIAIHEPEGHGSK